MKLSFSRPWGRTLTVLAVAGASLALAGCSLLGNIVADNTQAPTDPTVEVDTDAFAIAVGDCLNDGNLDGEVTSVPTIACDQPHDSEAYASIMVDDGSYPGEDAILAQADDECRAAFDSFAGINYDQSVLDFSYYYPTAGSWDNGDREILCLIYEFDVKTTGSLAGAAR
ncbi:MAG: septum formation family protein [Rhodoglobus sp.]